MLVHLRTNDVIAMVSTRLVNLEADDRIGMTHNIQNTAQASIAPAESFTGSYRQPRAPSRVEPTSEHKYNSVHICRNSYKLSLLLRNLKIMIVSSGGAFRRCYDRTCSWSFFSCAFSCSRAYWSGVRVQHISPPTRERSSNLREPSPSCCKRKHAVRTHTPQGRARRSRRTPETLT